MNSWGMIIGGWVAVLSALAAYAVWLLQRGRTLARDLRLGEGGTGTTGDEWQGDEAGSGTVPPNGRP